VFISKTLLSQLTVCAVSKHILRLPEKTNENGANQRKQFLQTMTLWNASRGPYSENCPRPPTFNPALGRISNVAVRIDPPRRTVYNPFSNPKTFLASIRTSPTDPSQDLYVWANMGQNI